MTNQTTGQKLYYQNQVGRLESKNPSSIIINPIHQRSMYSVDSNSKSNLQSCQKPIGVHLRQRSFRDISHCPTACQLHTSPKIVMQDIQHERYPRFTIILLHGLAASIICVKSIQSRPGVYSQPNPTTPASPPNNTPPPTPMP